MSALPHFNFFFPDCWPRSIRRCIGLWRMPTCMRGRSCKGQVKAPAWSDRSIVQDRTTKIFLQETEVCASLFSVFLGANSEGSLLFWLQLLLIVINFHASFVSGLHFRDTQLSLEPGKWELWMHVVSYEEIWNCSNPDVATSITTQLKSVRETGMLAQALRHFRVNTVSNADFHW